MSQSSPFREPICPQAWDDAVAREMIGKTLIVGFTYETDDGSPPTFEQKFGVISAVDALTGVFIDRGGEDRDFWLPPQLDAIFHAAPGVYRLKSSDEEVLDPDFLSSWTIQPPELPPLDDESTEEAP